MATNLLEMMSSSVGKRLVEHASGFLGVSESNVSAALPALLAGLMQKTASSGTSDLMRLLDTPELSSAATNLGSYLGGGEKTTSLPNDQREATPRTTKPDSSRVYDRDWWRSRSTVR